ncbi:hypothetical protein OPV22_027073 [Ensete ventricosum]|uniref:RRM domain-containing protein n=1 Tax=Ensete ventricosum TaxID=4639 RepID=A0AAV8P3U9_ENSVE|nr:hypothetical protein OPV22_027073 [Ensete ventricosum]
MMRCWRVKDSSAAIIPARRLWLRYACSKLFVVGLSYDTNEIALRDAFAEHGEVVEVKVICDRSTTSKSKGYGFVRFSSEKEATIALQKMDGECLDGRYISVHYANKG